MATRGTVSIYYRTTPGTGQSFWYADYAFIEGDSVTIRMQPSVGKQATDAQLQFHADQGLRERMAQHGEAYAPALYQIER